MISIILNSIILISMVLLFAGAIIFSILNLVSLKRPLLYLISLFTLGASLLAIICFVNITDPESAYDRGGCSICLEPREVEDIWITNGAPVLLEPDLSIEEQMIEGRWMITCVENKTVERWEWKVDDCLENPSVYLQKKYPGKQVVDLRWGHIQVYPDYPSWIVCDSWIGYQCKGKIDISSQDFEDYCHNFIGKVYWNETVCVNEGWIRTVREEG